MFVSFARCLILRLFSLLSKKGIIWLELLISLSWLFLVAFVLKPSKIIVYLLLVKVFIKGVFNSNVRKSRHYKNLECKFFIFKCFDCCKDVENKCWTLALIMRHLIQNVSCINKLLKNIKKKYFFNNSNYLVFYLLL